MSKISGKLACSKDVQCNFDHNGKIKEFLIELGIASQFRKNIKSDQATVQAVPYLQHPTHFALAVLYDGYDDPTQNGYLLWCLPKTKYSIEQFMEFSKTVLDPRDDRIIENGIFWSSPGNPSN